MGIACPTCSSRPSGVLKSTASRGGAWCVPSPRLPAAAPAASQLRLWSSTTAGSTLLSGLPRDPGLILSFKTVALDMDNIQYLT